MGNEILDSNVHSTSTNLDGFEPTRLPKDSSILTTGIIALPFSFGIVGIILSIITLVNASNSLKIYNENPEKYLEASVKKVRSGKVCAIVSLSLFGLGTLIAVLFVAANS